VCYRYKKKLFINSSSSRVGDDKMYKKKKKRSGNDDFRFQLSRSDREDEEVEGVVASMNG
jgi:hypothetical protein